MSRKQKPQKIKNNIEEVYPEDAELIRDLKETCLEIATTDAEAFNRRGNKRQNSNIQNSKKWHRLTETISEDTLTIYKTWKAQQQNLLRKPCSQLPKVSVCNLLVLLHVLKNAKNSPELDTEIKLYLHRAQKFPGSEPFWSSPALVNVVFRQCILTRNWDKMTLFCISLLKQNFLLYDPYVRKMCRIMIRLNPLIAKCELLDQFVVLTGLNNK